jgi:diguanylate cyclase (GGDEF)-like protein
MTLNMADVFDEYPNPVYIIKPIFEGDIANDFEYVYVNKAFAILLGRDATELENNRFVEIFGAGERQWLDAFGAAAREGRHFFVNHISDIINRKMYTEIFHVDPNMCCCITHDMQVVSQNLQTHQEEIVRFKANSDLLTGFYNRFYLHEISNVFTDKPSIGVTYIDINNLKNINDTCGHSAGDELILKVSKIICESYSESFIFRVDGDDFLIVTENCQEDKFIELSEAVKAHLEEDNVAAIGYKYYDNIEDLKICIDECEKLMREKKHSMKGLV